MEKGAEPETLPPAEEEADADDAAIWNSLPRPARRRQPRVQATIVSSAPTGGSNQREATLKRSKRSKKGKKRKSPLQWVQGLDLRLLLVTLIVLIIIALVFGGILFWQSGAVAAMARGDSGFSSRGGDSGDGAWNYSEDEDSSGPVPGALRRGQQRRDRGAEEQPGAYGADL